MLSQITHSLLDKAFLVQKMVYIKSNTNYDISDITLPPDIAHRIDMVCRGEMDEMITPTQYNDKVLYNFVPQNDKDCPTIAYIFSINCEEETEVIILGNHGLSKSYVWVNNEYIGESHRASIMRINLKKGNNIFCFLFSGQIPSLTVRVNKISNEKKVDYVSINSSIVKLYSEDIVNINYNKYEKDIYKGILFSFDRVHCDIFQDVVVDVVDYNSGKIYAQYVIKFNTPFEIDISQIDFGEDQERIMLDMCICYYKNGERWCLHRYFYFEDPIEGKRRFLEECAQFLKDSNILETTRALMEKRTAELNSVEEEDLSKLRNALWWARFSLSGLQTGRSACYEYLPGKNDVFFKSKLDNNYYHYDIYLPYDYDRSKKYPLVLHCAVSEFSNICMRCERSNYKSDIIIANLSARGVTSGSFIGDASMNEVFEIIKKNFSIDEERISMFGYSNGSTATWLQAQIAPHKFAAIAPCAGIFNSNMIQNLGNMKIFDIESPHDHMYWKYSRLDDGNLSNMEAYSLIEAESITHGSFQNVYFFKDLVEELSKYTINKYPDRICFRAVHNRHLDTYWISVHSIEDSWEYGDIEVSVKSNDTINISCCGVTGVTVRIPPQITADKVYIYINGQCLVCERPSNGEISICKNGETDEFTFGTADKQNFKIYHGTGLLDVYMKPMSIINFASSFDTAVNSAIQFSSPKTNTYAPKIYVSYPIYTEDDLDIPSFKERSLIILDNNSSHPFACELRAYCQVEMDSNGFTYKGERYEGSYCIMQIFNHPHNPECSVLYINSNDVDTYRKNFFTRSVTMPMYSNERHPYLNNAALIYYNNKYYSIFEYGCEMIQVNQ